MKIEYTNSILAHAGVCNSRGTTSKTLDCLYYCSDEVVSESNSALDNCESIVIIDKPISFAKNFQPTFEFEKHIAFADYLTSGSFKKNSKKSEYALDSKKMYTFESIVEYNKNCRAVNCNAFKEDTHAFSENDNKLISTIAITNRNGHQMLHSNKCPKASVVDLILEDFSCTSDTSTIKTMENLPHSPLFILLEKPKRFYSRYTNSKSKVNSNKNLLNTVRLINTEILTEMENDGQNSSSLLSVEEVCPQIINSVSKISFIGSQCLYENLLHLSMHFNCVGNDNTNNNSNTSEHNTGKQSPMKPNVGEISLIGNTSQGINCRAQEIKIQPEIPTKDSVIYISPTLSELMSSILFLQKKFAHSWSDVSCNSNSNKDFYGFSSVNEDNAKKTISTSFNINEYLLQFPQTVEQNSAVYLNQTENNIESTTCERNDYVKDNEFVERDTLWDDDNCEFWLNFRTQEVMDIENIISAETQRKLTSKSHQYNNQLHINVGLQTASGKRLNVSDKSRHAVQHLVNESFSSLAGNATNYEKELQATKMKIQSKAKILKIVESENNMSEKTATYSTSRAYPDHKIICLHALNFEDNTEGSNLSKTQALIDPFHYKVVPDICHSEIPNKSNKAKKNLDIKSRIVNVCNYETPETLKPDKELQNNLLNSPYKLNCNYNESVKSSFVPCQISKSESILNDKNFLAMKAEKQKVIKELINHDPNETLANILHDLEAVKNQTRDCSNRAIFAKKHEHDEIRKRNDYYISKEVTPSDLKSSTNIRPTEYIGSSNLEITSIIDTSKSETLPNTRFYRNHENDANNCLSRPNIWNPYVNDTSTSTMIRSEPSIIGRKNLMSLSKKLKRKKERANQQINDSEINPKSFANIDGKICIETSPKYTIQKTRRNYQTTNCTPSLQYFISNASTCSTPILKQTEYHRMSYSINGSQPIDWNTDNEYDKSITRQSLDNFNKYNTFANNINNIPKHLTIEQRSATQLKDFSITSVTSASSIPLNTSPFVLSTAQTSISEHNKQKYCRPSGLRRTRSAQKKSVQFQ